MKVLMLKLKDVAKICGISKATIYRRINAGKFPKPVPVSDQAMRWRWADIERWITDPAGWKESFPTSCPTG